MIDNKTLYEKISEKFPDVSFEEFKGMLTVIAAKSNLTDIFKFLKENPDLVFDYLTDLTGVDYLKEGREPRFNVVYHLYSFKNNHRICVKLPVPEEDLEVPSASGIWKAAIWQEREAFEMFGFQFNGHPDLRRLLLPDVFDGFPLRKDYPLRGRGERDVILDLK
jgi:NADH-quinone oxidoreductase subunit C